LKTVIKSTTRPHTQNLITDAQNTPLGVYFVLLARYVPNVAKRSIWDQCNIEDRLTDDRPTTDLCSWKSLPGRTSNGHISLYNGAR